MGADASVQRDHLNLNDLDRQAKHLLHSGIAHLVMARRCDLSADDISQVECVRDRFLEFAQSIYDHMLYNARTRLQNQQELGRYDYKIVSLGTDCLSRVVPTRWGLKPPKNLDSVVTR